MFMKCGDMGIGSRTGREGEPGVHTPLEEILSPLKLLGMVTFVTTFAVIDHFKVKYEVETVLVQVINSSIRCPPHQA